LIAGRALAYAEYGGLVFPNATNTGANLPAALFTITGSATTAAAVNTALAITGNSGWSWNGSAFTIHSGDKLDSLNFNGGFTLSVNNVTIRNSNIFGAGGGELTVSGGVSGTTVSNCVFTNSHSGSNDVPIILAPSGGPTVNTTIQDCTISGSDAGTNRCIHCITDVSGTSTGLQILRCDMFYWRAAVNITSGLVRDCYIHDAGYVSGDHSECAVLDGVPSGVTLTYRHNTLLNQLSETASIDMSTVTGTAPVQQVTIDSNFMSSGGYDIYGGNSGTAGARNWSVTDLACSIAGGTTLNDASLVAADSGATVTGAGIPVSTTISGVTPGVSATLSQSCTNSGSVDVTLHYSNNIMITNNRFSRLPFGAGGGFGYSAHFDTAPASNAWQASNVTHDTNVTVGPNT
jgi:hypothetical protein